jgi:hypothetical protein
VFVVVDLFSLKPWLGYGFEAVRIRVKSIIPGDAGNLLTIV